MTTRNFLVVFICVSALHFVQAQNNTDKPNFIFYLSDDQDKLDYGCYGNSVVHTPKVDQLASEGMKFNKAFTAQAICAPSRSQLYTGLYPLRNGCFANHTASRSGLVTIAQLLKDNGYDVILAGKLHIKPTSVYDWSYYWKDEAIEGIGPHDAIPITAISEYLDTVQKPFCMFVTSHYPHGPFADGDEYSEDDIFKHPYADKLGFQASRWIGYYNNIAIDNTLLEMTLNALDSSGFKDNTVFCYSADHGKSGKYTVYDGGLNVSFIVRWPGVVDAGAVSDAIIQYIDVTPTFLELAGVDVPEYMDGKSFANVLKGQAATHQKFIYGVRSHQNILKPYIYPSRSVRSEKYLYIKNFNSIEVYLENLGDDAYINKFIERGALAFPDEPYEELYDLDTDPYQLVNVAKDSNYQDAREQMSHQLALWMVQQSDFLLSHKMPLLIANNNPLDKKTSSNNIPVELEGILVNSEAWEFNGPVDFSLSRLPFVPVTEVSFSTDTIEVAVSDEINVNMAFAPSNASEKTYILKSLNEEIATIGLPNTVYGIQPGFVKIVGESFDGNFTDTTYVKVVQAPTGNLYVSNTGDDNNNGTYDYPFRTISKAVTVVQPGETIYIRGGTYRERVSLNKSGTAASPIVISGYADEEVIITGADIYDGWIQDGDYWKLPWTTYIQGVTGDQAYKFLALSEEEAANHPNPNILRGEMVIFEDTILMTYSSKEDVVPGSFWVEGTTENPTMIWARFPGNASPDGNKVEIAVRSQGLNLGRTSNIHVKKLTVRHCASRNWHGAVQTGSGSEYNLYEDLIVEGNNVEGFVIDGWTNPGSGHIVRRLLTRNNGNKGIWAAGNDLLFEYCKSFGNNWKGFNSSWGAGAAKFVRTDNLVVRYFEAAYNNGPGIWVDVENINATVEYSVAYKNKGAGIFLENKTFYSVVSNCIAWENEIENDYFGAIYVSAASNNAVIHNTTFGNWESPRVNSDDRDPTLNNVFINNIFAEPDGLRYKNAQVANSTVTEGNVFNLNPLFEKNWHISKYSPAAFSGVELPDSLKQYALYDIDGDPRPTTGADVGADQFGVLDSTIRSFPDLELRNKAHEAMIALYGELEITHVESVDIDYDSISIFEEDNLMLSATVEPTNATDLRYFWSSDNENIATINSLGEVTGISAGQTMVRCMTNDGGFQDSCIVHVKADVPVSEIIISKDTINIKLGEDFNLTAEILPWNATDTTLNWNSAFPSIATIDNNGAVYAVSIGQTYVYAISADSSVSDSCLVIVDPISTVNTEQYPDIKRVKIFSSRPGKVKIECAVPGSTVEIYNLVGVKIHQEMLEHTEAEIGLRFRNKGLILVLVTYNDDATSKKLYIN